MHVLSRGKRGLAGSMVFAVFDHDALVSALQTVWDDIAPSAMFTAAAITYYHSLKISQMPWI